MALSEVASHRAGPGIEPWDVTALRRQEAMSCLPTVLLGQSFLPEAAVYMDSDS